MRRHVSNQSDLLTKPIIYDNFSASNQQSSEYNRNELATRGTNNFSGMINDRGNFYDNSNSNINHENNF
jgi:hypothetical protein